MSDELVGKLAEKLLEFNLKLSCWQTMNYGKEFNVNGKNDLPLTRRQFEILILAYKLELSTVSEIEDVLKISKSSLSLTIGKLVEDGYLRKESYEDKEDKRKVHIYITEKGIDVLYEAYERVILMFKKFYETLDEKQKEDLVIGIERLGNIF